MRWFSIVAIYGLFWVLGALLALPFGMRTHDEAGLDKIPGQADSAPADFRPGRVVLRATILAAIATAAFVANYSYGWITMDDINLAGKPPQMDKIVRGN